MNRLLNILLSLSLVVSIIGPQLNNLTSLISHAQGTSSFVDIDEDHEYREDIEYLKTNKIVEGYAVEGQSEKIFKADYELNRAELTKIIIESKYSDEEINSCWKEKNLKNWETMYFQDVKMDEWFAKYICVAKEKKIIDGYPDKNFRPENPVNFAEASKIISNTLNLDEAPKKDEVWYKPFTRAIESRKGIPPTIRSFGKIITRGEMARMIHAAKEPIKARALSMKKLEELEGKKDELPQVNSCNALIKKLDLDKPRPALRKNKGINMNDEGIMFSNTEADRSPEEKSTGYINKTESVSADENFSKTNTQVAGVDEADIIKNDGEYIYMIKNNTIRIVDAYPAKKLKEVSSIEVDDKDFKPIEMYVDTDQLVIIGQIRRERYYAKPFMEPTRETTSIMPPHPGFNENRMKVYIYDISDRKKPKKQRSLEIEGNYTSSRKVGENVYFVINQWIPYYSISDTESADIIIPRYKDSAKNNIEKPIVRCMGIQYFPGFRNRNYLIVAGLNIAKNNSELKRKVIIGSSQNIYASRKNLYIASPYYGETVVQDREDLFINSESMTLIYRFSLGKEGIEYQNQALVPGNILNQFSMDESRGYFRIATTRNYNNTKKGFITDNNLYILNTHSDEKGNMSIIGRVEQIAPGERIKSVRFMGNRAYLVTFKNVDPLFVIDLAKPSNPKILGKLKIPGWSDYLHPYDETHLIGFGREVDPSAENAERLTSEFLMGMKISIFDVQDILNPKEMFKEVIGTRGTTSELLRNHKAILFDKDKNLLAFPITITKLINPERGIEYGNIKTVFSGGIVYNIDLKNGFTIKGKVTHYEDNSLFENSGEYFSGEFGRNIQRLIYIRENLYSISPDFVRSFNLDTLKSISFIKLAGAKSDGVDYIDGIFF